MSPPEPGRLERLLELLADRAGGEPFRPEEAVEMNRLLAEHPEVDPEAFDHAAAALHLALLGPATQPLPVGLRQRILDDARASARNGPAPPRVSLPRPSRLPWGWIAAAAASLLLVLRTLAPQGGPPSYDDVLAAGDVIVAAWDRTDDPDAAGVTGDLAWSDSLQMGYMRFRGLPANDPGRGQYQLWIFDSQRPSETPVDGGVFDSGGGEIRVPIDAKLEVAEPTLFAVTYERPGGVVVSSRERLLVKAARP